MMQLSATSSFFLGLLWFAGVVFLGWMIWRHVRKGWEEKEWQKFWKDPIARGLLLAFIFIGILILIFQWLMALLVPGPQAY
jgi:threonine/homoserine/homoserine lactone efflux protein